jgi:hypothetical protein
VIDVSCLQDYKTGCESRYIGRELRFRRALGVHVDRVDLNGGCESRRNRSEIQLRRTLITQIDRLSVQNTM